PSMVALYSPRVADRFTEAENLQPGCTETWLRDPLADGPSKQDRSTGPDVRPRTYTVTVKIQRRGARVLVAGVVVAALAAPLAAWASGSFRSNSSSFVSFRNEFVTFRYAAPWASGVWHEEVAHFQPMVYLSTQATHDPCRTSVSAGATSITCGFPLAKLDR